MARPPKYQSEAEKPVNVSLRLPRDLYDQAQHHARMRRTTLTELMVEGLHLRLEAPTDPRDIIASQDITAMQELKQMITAEVHAILAAQRLPIAELAPPLSHGKNNTVIQDKASRGRHKLTPRQVRALRDKHLRGVPVPALLEEYAISRASLFRYLQSDQR